MSPATAETVALKALDWLVGSGKIGGFLASSGLDRDSLRARATDHDLLNALLEYVLSHEKLAISFCEHAHISSRDLHLAQHLLERR